MKRVLTLDCSDPKAVTRFGMMYEAVLQAGDKSDKRDRARIRKEARLLEAFDGVSEPDATKPVVCGHCGGALNATVVGQPAVREPRLLKAGVHELVLAGEDHELLSQYLDMAPWLPVVARAAVDAQDFVGAAEKRDE